MAQVAAGNTSKNLLNEVRQMIYSLYQPKGIEQYNEFNKGITKSQCYPSFQHAPVNISYQCKCRNGEF